MIKKEVWQLAYSTGVAGDVHMCQCNGERSHIETNGNREVKIACAPLLPRKHG